MAQFKEAIPKAPEDIDIIYSHPYQLPDYQLDEFEIDFNDFPIEVQNTNDSPNKSKNTNNSIFDQSSLEKEELEEKFTKIQELIRLKTLEKNCQLKKKMHEERSGIEEEIESIKSLISELGNYAADLSYILLNYKDKKQNAVLKDLHTIIYSQNLDLTVDDDNFRCNAIKEKLSSLKPEKH